MMSYPLSSNAITLGRALGQIPSWEPSPLSAQTKELLAQLKPPCTENEEVLLTRLLKTASLTISGLA
jgi:hypothetical protein